MTPVPSTSATLRVSSITQDWVVDGHGFTPAGLIPYDPELADEIEASIRDYLERR